MKSVNYFNLFFLLLTLFSCETIEEFSGSVIFYAGSATCPDFTEITVTIEGKSKKFTPVSVTPECRDSQLGARFRLEPGTYDYSAWASNGDTWAGSVTIYANDCQPIALHCTQVSKEGCSNTCAYANDGVCDDGGSGSVYNVCPCGTDCNDCGTRSNCEKDDNDEDEDQDEDEEPDTGSVVFWTDKDCGCGNISINVGGQFAGQNTNFSSSGLAPNCGASGFVTMTLPVGTHTISATCNGLSWNGDFTITKGQCTPFQLRCEGKADEEPNNEGQITFWTGQNCGCGFIDVSIGGIFKGQITKFFGGGYPGCDANGNVTETLLPGTYAYKATCGNLSWNGNFNISANECASLRLDCTNNDDNTQNTGKVSFWTKQNDSGKINVYVAGNFVGSLDQWFTTGSPSTCGESGTVTVEKVPGTYSMSAESTSGHKWSGNITIEKNRCLLFELQ